MHEQVTEAITRIRRESLPQSAVPLASPRIITPEHVVGPDVLPRGPKMVASAVDAEAWEAVWYHSEAELLTNPKRGGVAYGLQFSATQGNRRGWAVWVAGSFGGGFLFRGAGPVPQKLSAKALKELLAGRCLTSR
jgi:hypothetical protein